MDVTRSRRYLTALNIPVWRQRATATAGPAREGRGVVGAPAESAPVAPRFGEPPPAGFSAAPVRFATRPVASPPDEGPPAPPRAPAPAGRPPALPDVPVGVPEPPPWLDEIPPDDDPPPRFGAEAEPDWPPPPVVPTPSPALPSPPNPVAGMDWDALAAAVADCRACRLCTGRTNTVFGTGNRQAALMFVGEGPGQEEDQRGEPFVGRAGQLLTRMLAAIGLAREQVYIANVVKCRPPNNRNPQPDEAAACRAYLTRQIALVRPRLLVSLGRVSANALLGTEAPVGSLRGRLHQYRPDDGGPPVPLLVTYHPSYYLRSPAEKARGWTDLQRIVRFLAGDGASG